MPRRRNQKNKTSTKRETVATPSGWESPIVIIFADIVGCSEISNHEKIFKYNQIVQTFQNLFKATSNKFYEKFYSSLDRTHFKPQVRGDEGSLMIFRKDSKPTNLDLWADDVDTAINIALELKRKWLLCWYNQERILAGQLPSDISIGIHFGKAWINFTAEKEYQPEGYAINLTKRIENHSREGVFTHIDISEAACDRLYFLTDEMTYTFADPRLIKPKGISQGINVFEVKHHFLPTDWYDAEIRESIFDPTDEEVKIVEVAHRTNPTNLWLAEECIMMQMLKKYKELEDKDETEDKHKLKDAYKDAEALSKKLATGPLRDAGSVCLVGLIVGESVVSG